MATTATASRTVIRTTVLAATLAASIAVTYTTAGTEERAISIFDFHSPNRQVYADFTK
jgi:hypothetical protein